MSAIINPGTAGSSTSYLHTQAVAALVWNVTHNLGVVSPVVAVVDAAGAEVIAQVQHTSINTLDITLTVATAGTARVVA